MTLRVVVLFAVAGRLFGQLGSDTLAISASHVPSIQSDQAVFNVTIDSTPAQGLDDVLTALQASGITAGSLSDVYSLTDGTPEWSFTLPVSFDKVQTTAASLVSLQQTIAKSKSGMTLSFSIDGVQASSALAQSQSCPFTDLVSDARAQAKRLADAAGFVSGPILSVETGDSTFAAIIPQIRTGDFTFANPFAGNPALTFTAGPVASFLLSVVHVAPSPICAITVKFRLIRYQ